MVGLFDVLKKNKKEYQRKDAKDIVFSDDGCPSVECAGKLVYYKIRVYG